MSELTLPAGSMAAALSAFDGGADAVYVGLKHFSARKGAVNFSLEEVAQLRHVASRLHKKVYIALNTLLDDTELISLLPTLRRLELLQVDGIIVQDLGLARLINCQFPSLDLHSSTQLAAHSAEAVKQLQQIGFKRIVLSRELTIDEIKTIRYQCPDADLKVFIHGAMCYGFSGLCMASHLLSGRSANRGECAQICRTYFSYEQQQLYCASLKDLSVGPSISQLLELGINAFKVEGRMKSPSYTYWAASYYRQLIDGTDDQRSKEYVDAQFSRFQNAGWMFDYDKHTPSDHRQKEALVSPFYPSHIGQVVGEITHISGKNITLQLTSELAIRDGVMIIEGFNQVQKFAVRQLTTVAGKHLTSSAGHKTVVLKTPSLITASVPAPLYRISKHDSLVPASQLECTHSFRYPLQITITVEKKEIRITAGNVPKWMGGSYSVHLPLDAQKARSKQQMRAHLTTIFSQPSDGYFTLGSLKLINATPWADDEVFLPLSQLKEIRRLWYEKLNAQCERFIAAPSFEKKETDRQTGELLPPRHLLPQSNGPWLDPCRMPQEFAPVHRWHYLSLPPVSFDQQATFAALNQVAQQYGQSLRVGLNNIAHLSWAKEHPQISCYIDIYLYMSNKEAALLMVEQLPNLIGMYHWMERELPDTSSWPLRCTPVSSQLRVPLFISRACFRYDSLGQRCQGCSRNLCYEIEQNGLHYEVNVVNCLTTIRQLPAS